MPVSVRATLRGARLRVAAVEAVMRRLLALVGRSAEEVHVLLAGDRLMRRLNGRYRRRDYPTDVLAFPPSPQTCPPISLLGDVVVCLPQAIRQARAAGHSVDAELTALLIHGLLHLCGYDHERGAVEARRMQRKEQALMQAMGPIPNLTTRRGRA